MTPAEVIACTNAVSEHAESVRYSTYYKDKHNLSRIMDINAINSVSMLSWKQLYNGNIGDGDQFAGESKLIEILRFVACKIGRHKSIVGWSERI